MNRLLVTTTSVLAGAALVFGGGVVAANAAPAIAPSTVAVSTASTCTFGEHLVSAWLEVPKAMRTDLKAARALPAGSERRAAVKAVATKALDGGYGADVEAKAEFLKSHKGELKGIRPLPSELKADLKTLHGEKGKKAKLAEANTIADKALAGDYGSKVEELAKAAKSSSAWQDCSPKVSGSGTTS